MGDGELCVAHRPNRLEALRREAGQLTGLTGLRHAIWSRDELAERAYRGPEAHGALYIPAGFGLHPLKYLRGLARAAMARGVAINGDSCVTHWSKEGDRHHLITAAGSLRVKRVLHGISFSVCQGDIFGFVGPNGAGKTTTLKMLAGLLHPTAGTARVMGHVPWHREPDYLRKISMLMGQRSQMHWEPAR